MPPTLLPSLSPNHTSPLLALQTPGRPSQGLALDAPLDSFPQHLQILLPHLLWVIVKYPPSVQCSLITPLNKPFPYPPALLCLIFLYSFYHHLTYTFPSLLSSLLDYHLHKDMDYYRYTALFLVLRTMPSMCTDTQK